MPLIWCPCPQLWCHHGHSRTARAGRAQHSVPRASPSPSPGRGWSQSGWSQRCHRAPTHCPDPVTLRAALPSPRAAPAALRSDQGLAGLLRVACPPPAWGKAGSRQGRQGCVRPARRCPRHPPHLRGWRRPRAPPARAEPGRGWALTYRCSGAEPVGAPGKSWGSAGRDRASGWARLKAAGTPRFSHRSAPPRRIPASIPGGRGAVRSGSGGGRAR